MNASISQPYPRTPVIPNGILGMLFLLATEMMFFGGLISAYIINRAGTGIWPPEGQPRLAVEVTAFNTLLLVCSAITIFLMNRSLAVNNSARAKKLLHASLLLGAAFILLQGSEWIRLLSFGLTTRSGLYGAFFYTIIGAHALHTLVGLGLLLLMFFRFSSKPAEEIKSHSETYSLYWYFVAGIWPVLYYLVYLY